MSRFSLFAILLSSLLFIRCNTNSDFLIAKGQVGKLGKLNTLGELETLFAGDSIVKDTAFTQIGARVNKINIYEKGGAHLLSITPSLDSVPKVEVIRIHDPRYVTEKGVGLQSTFKDIREKHQIRKIVTSRNNVVVFLRDSDAYFTIAKTELPSSLQYASSVNIEAVQIPDAARIKYMMVGWN